MNLNHYHQIHLIPLIQIIFFIFLVFLAKDQHPHLKNHFGHHHYYYIHLQNFYHLIIHLNYFGFHLNFMTITIIFLFPFLFFWNLNDPSIDNKHQPIHEDLFILLDIPVSNPASQILHFTVPFSFFQAIVTSTHLSLSQTGQLNSVGSLNTLFLGAYFALFLFPIINKFH